MKVSVVITTHNELIDLEATVLNAIASTPQPYEVFVVDDASDEPVAPRFKAPCFRGVQVIRAEHQGGCARARRLGAALATGDVLIFLDSHMRMPPDWLRHVQYAVEKHQGSIFCTAFSCFTDWQSDTPGLCGAHFSPDPDEDRVSVEPHWRNRGDRAVIDTTPCLLGACYIIPTDIWRGLGGLNPNLFGWGSDEQDLSLRAWGSGYEVRRINGLRIAHQLERDHLPGYNPQTSPNGSNFTNTWEVGFNCHVVAMTCFGDGVYERLFERFLHERFPEVFTNLRLEHHLERILDFREFVQSTRRRTDAELESLNVYALPTVDGQQERLDRWKAKEAANGADAD